MRILLLFALFLMLLQDVSYAGKKCYVSNGDDVCIDVEDSAEKSNINHQSDNKKDNNDFSKKSIVKADYKSFSNNSNENDSVFNAISGNDNANLTTKGRGFKSKVITEYSEGNIKSKDAKLDMLAKSIENGIKELEKNGINLKRQTFHDINPNTRRYFDFAIFGSYGLLIPSFSKYSVVVDDSIQSYTYHSVLNKEAGGGFKINIGSDRMSMFINMTVRKMFHDISESSSYLNGKLQTGIVYALASNHKKTVIFSGLVGVEGIYNSIDPNLVREEDGLGDTDQIKQDIDDNNKHIKSIEDKRSKDQVPSDVAKKEIERLKNIGEDLKEKLGEVDTFNNLSLSTKMVGAGLMFGFKLTEYAGDRNIFSQGIHISAGPSIIHNNISNSSDVGVMLNLGTFFEHNIKISKSVYFRWFVDVEAFGQLNVSPRIPINIDNLQNLKKDILSETDSFLSNIHDVLGHVANVTSRSQGIVSTADSLIITIGSLTEKLTSDLLKEVNTAQNKDLSKIIDSINKIKFDKGIADGLKNLDHTIGTIMKTIPNIGPNITNKITKILSDYIKNVVGLTTGSNNNIDPSIWRNAMETALTKGVEDLIFNDILGYIMYENLLKEGNSIVGRVGDKNFKGDLITKEEVDSAKDVILKIIGSNDKNVLRSIIHGLSPEEKRIINNVLRAGSDIDSLTDDELTKMITAFKKVNGEGKYGITGLGKSDTDSETIIKSMLHKFIHDPDANIDELEKFFEKMIDNTKVIHHNKDGTTVVEKHGMVISEILHSNEFLNFLKNGIKDWAKEASVGDTDYDFKPPTGSLFVNLEHKMQHLIDLIEKHYTDLMHHGISAVSDEVRDLLQSIGVSLDSMNSILEKLQHTEMFDSGFRLGTEVVPRVDFGVGLYFKI